MKNEINKIWQQRAYDLEKLHSQLKWLINCNMPLKRKNAILNENLDRFVLTLLEQDKHIRKVIKTLLDALWEAA